MNQQKVGQFLKTLRCQKSITQADLAEILGVSNRSISRWENGTTMPDFDLVIELAKYYEVEAGEILDGERRVFPVVLIFTDRRFPLLTFYAFHHILMKKFPGADRQIQPANTGERP